MKQCPYCTLSVQDSMEKCYCGYDFGIAPSPKRSPFAADWKRSLGTGALAGATAGAISHYVAGGQLSLPLFIVFFVLSLGSLKGFGRVIGSVAFAVVAAVVVSLFEYLNTLAK